MVGEKKRGGARLGAGRKPKKPDEILQRKQRQLRAHDDEWQIINKFAEIVKHGDKEKCRVIVERLMENR